MTPRDLLPEVRELLRRAILTLAALPAPGGPREPRNPLGHRLVRDAIEAYGYQPPAVVRFQPTPRDVSIYLEVLSWLTKYEQKYGSRKVKIFMAWSFEVPLRIIAWHQKCSEATIQRWRDGVALTVAEEEENNVKKVLEGACIEEGSGCTNREHHPKCPLNTGVESKTPNIWLAADNKPIPGAHLIAGSPAESDRKKTIKRLERNARREARRKRA